MAERLKLQKPLLTVSRRKGWAARDEVGRVEYFDNRESALAWVFGNWDWCDVCDKYTPYHPRHEVCRLCGRRWGEDESLYQGAIFVIANGLAKARGYRDWFDLKFQEAEGYLEDAEKVIDLLPHVLPLDVREALYGDLEANDA